MMMMMIDRQKYKHRYKSVCVDMLVCVHRQVHGHAYLYICVFKICLSPSSAREGLGAATPQQQ